MTETDLINFLRENLRVSMYESENFGDKKVVIELTLGQEVISKDFYYPTNRE